MADNFPVTPGSGGVIAADDLGGPLAQRIKLVLGPDGVGVDAASDLGASNANTLRIVSASNDPAVTALGILTGAVTSSRMAVNLIAGQTGITAAAGASAVNTPRVILASDDPAVTALGILTASVSSSRMAVNLIAGQAGITAGAGTVAVNTPRMTLASDDPLVTAMSRGVLSPISTITRPATTVTYGVQTAFANSPATVGGHVLPGVVSASGKSGIMTNLMIVSSVASLTALQGEIWLFDQAVTAIADTAPWVLSVTDALKLVAIVPFQLTIDASTSVASIQGLNIGFTPVGSADLRYLVKVTSGYSGVSGSTLSLKPTVVGGN